MTTLYWSKEPVIVTSNDTTEEPTDYTQSNQASIDTCANTYTISGTFKVVRISKKKKPKHWKFIKRYHTKQAKLKAANINTSYWNRIRSQLALVHKHALIFCIFILIVLNQT